MAVKSIHPMSQAAELGVKVGWRVLALDGAVLQAACELRAALDSLRAEGEAHASLLCLVAGKQTSKRGDSLMLKVVKHLHLGLNLKIGQSYSFSELHRRCKGNTQTVAKLVNFCTDTNYLRRVDNETSVSILQEK